MRSYSTQYRRRCLTTAVPCSARVAMSCRRRREAAVPSADEVGQRRRRKITLRVVGGRSEDWQGQHGFAVCEAWTGLATLERRPVNTGEYGLVDSSSFSDCFVITASSSVQTSESVFLSRRDENRRRHSRHCVLLTSLSSMDSSYWTDHLGEFQSLYIGILR